MKTLVLVVLLLACCVTLAHSATSFQHLMLCDQLCKSHFPVFNRNRVIACCMQHGFTTGVCSGPLAMCMKRPASGPALFDSPTQPSSRTV